MSEAVIMLNILHLWSYNVFISKYIWEPAPNIFSASSLPQSYYEPRSIGAYSKRSLNQIMAIIKKKTLTYETLWKKDKIIL